MTRSQLQAAFSLILIFALVALPTSALAEADPDASASLNSVVPASATDTALRSEVDQLKELVREQQKRIEALESARGNRAGLPVNATVLPSSASSIGALPVQNATSQTSQTSPGSTSQAPSQTLSTNQNYQNAGSSDERIRNLERQIKGLGPISFSGDVRLRGEPFFGGPTDQSLDRVRERIRARFNAVADLGSQFRAGISLASGDINDPTSTNQTLTGFYTRKTIALDQAFVEYKPKQAKFLALIGGKFRYPWFNTELTWDKDLNPEGVAETFAFDIHTPVLTRFAVVAFQLPFAEVANTSVNDKLIAQQITYGGQIQTAWQLISRVRLSAYSGFYWFDGSDSIAVALARASAKNPQTPLTGLLPLGTGNTVQNAIFTTTATNVVTIGGTRYPTGVANITNAQYASQYALFDNIARFDIDTGHLKFPVTLIGDYVQNTEACANLANITAAPTNTTSITYAQTKNFNCVSNQRRGYWAEARVGRLQQRGDWQLGYTRIYIEREAVLSNFNYSDIRQGSNVTEHRIDGFYQLDRSVQLGAAALIGRPLGTNEPWFTRLQFDAIYIF